MNSPSFQQEVLDMLKPKIKAVLYQTNLQERLDLEQEIILMIITSIKTKEFRKAPSFFELIEDEKTL